MEHINEKLVNWASILDEVTLAQAIQTSSMPFIYPHLALMPDAHLGKGSTVGSVIPTRGAVMPAAVGVDIGCGMMAVRTQFQLSHPGDIDRRKIRENIEELVPLSPGKYNTSVTPRAERYVEQLEQKAALAKFDPGVYGANWRLQLGSLGGGNHFIEVTLDEENYVWTFLHSGSRGVGNKIANRHIRTALALCEKWWIQLPHKDLAYFAEGTTEFWEYIREMMWAQDFAMLNRQLMMDRTILALEDVMGEVHPTEVINCHHNYTTQEKHRGERVWLTRKGAINAGIGQPGLIPGSMATASYVVEGKGHPMAFASAPHGAGRVFSRRRARDNFTHEDLKQRMKAADVEWRDSEAFVDEIPDAYKDVDVVMHDARDLVEVKHTLHQIINVKGE